MPLTIDVHRATLAQVYLPSFHPTGAAGLVERRDVLEWTGFAGVIMQPVNPYRAENDDGPYTPLDHLDVHPRWGGAQRLAEVNHTLLSAGITPIGDAVIKHIDALSKLVALLLSDPERWAPWFRLTDDPAVLATWGSMFNHFGLPSRIWEAALKRWRATVFYPEQWELNIGHPEVVKYIDLIIDTMTSGWNYRGIRIDAAADLSPTVLTTPQGRYEPAGFELIEHLRRKYGDDVMFIVEAGGTSHDIAQLIEPGRAHAAYDFPWVPVLIQSLDTEDWDPLHKHFEELPPTAGHWLHLLGNHDDRWLRVTEYRDDIVARHGGRDGEFTCFGGMAISPPMRNIVPSEQAFVMLEGLTILSAGIPMVYQTDLGGWGGDIYTKVRDPRDPNRCLVPWDSSLPRAGWPESADYPLEPTWETRSVRDQMADPQSVMSRLRQFIALRAHHPAIGPNTELRIDTDSRQVFPYVRSEAPDEPALVVIANASRYGQTATLDLRRWAGWHVRRLAPGPNVDWTSRRSWIGRHQYEIGLAPHTVEVLDLRPPMAEQGPAAHAPRNNTHEQEW